MGILDGEVRKLMTIFGKYQGLGHSDERNRNGACRPFRSESRYNYRGLNCDVYDGGDDNADYCVGGWVFLITDGCALPAK